MRIRLTDDQGKQLQRAVGPKARTPTTDIVTVTGHRLPQFIGSKLLTPLDTGRLKNWDKLASAYKGAPQLTVDGSVYGCRFWPASRLARNTDYTQGLRTAGPSCSIRNTRA